MRKNCLNLTTSQSNNIDICFKYRQQYPRGERRVLIKGEKVFLRDFIKEDIEDRIRWETIETEWLEWDAPWEMEEGPFNLEEYRRLMTKRLSRKLDPNEFRYSFQICINDESKKHIGWVNAYYIDNDYQYTEGQGYLTIGINIPDLNSRRKGYATEAWLLYIRYALNNGYKDIFTQTWSGNFRVIGLIEKLRFKECMRKKDLRKVRGKLYDGLTFKLDLNSFKKAYNGGYKK